MKHIAICIGLIMTLVLGDSGITAIAAPRDLIAIDILLLPDEGTAARARAINARLRQVYPAGFALDATHTPHITLLQCYVRRADLDAVTAAVERVFRTLPPAGMSLTAIGLFDSSLGSVDVTGISLRTTPELARLQQAIVAAVTPLMQHGGGPDAFVDAPRSDTIDWTATYVDRFIERSSGEHFAPHVTTGIGTPEIAGRLTRENVATFDVKIDGAGIYQLGDIGTARARLWVLSPH